MGRYTPNTQDAELQAVARAMTEPDALLLLNILHTPPAKLLPAQVTIAAADGVDWNPGAGAGVYAYYGGSWKKLG